MARSAIAGNDGRVVKEVLEVLKREGIEIKCTCGSAICATLQETLAMLVVLILWNKIIGKICGE